jgi:hypothetical protein
VKITGAAVSRSKPYTGLSVLNGDQNSVGFMFGRSHGSRAKDIIATSDEAEDRVAANAWVVGVGYNPPRPITIEVVPNTEATRVSGAFTVHVADPGLDHTAKMTDRRLVVVTDG